MGIGIGCLHAYNIYELNIWHNIWYDFNINTYGMIYLYGYGIGYKYGYMTEMLILIYLTLFFLLGFLIKLKKLENMVKCRFVFVFKIFFIENNLFSNFKRQDYIFLKLIFKNKFKKI